MCHKCALKSFIPNKLGCHLGIPVTSGMQFKNGYFEMNKGAFKEVMEGIHCVSGNPPVLQTPHYEMQYGRSIVTTG